MKKTSGWYLGISFLIFIGVAILFYTGDWKVLIIIIGFILIPTLDFLWIRLKNRVILSRLRKEIKR